MNKDTYEKIKKHITNKLPHIEEEKIERTIDFIYTVSTWIADNIKRKILYRNSKKIWKKQ